MDLLLKNGPEEDHASLITRHLETADSFICIVAFAKMSGLRLLLETLADRVANGLSATFVVGIDFFQSEPEVLRSLLRLRASAAKIGGKVSVYMGSEADRCTFHPKVYWFKRKREEALVVGSANMTSGGFSDNHELSVALSGADGKWRKRLDKWIAERVKERDIVEAKPALINRYEQRRDIYRATMKAAEKRAHRSMDAPSGQTIVLNDLLAEMQEDNGPDGFSAQVKHRRRNYRKAVKLLSDLAGAPDLKPRDFLPRYEEQLRYWHSGGLHRGKSSLAKKAPQYQAALRALAAEPSQDVGALFDLLKSFFDKIPRAGTNVLTEILHTRDPKRFPVMNRNSVAGLGLANIRGYPRKPAKSNLDGETYRRFAFDAVTLCKNLGLQDLGELDVLFNFAYWNSPEPNDEDSAPGTAE